MGLTSYHEPAEFRKCQKETGDNNPCVLPTSQNPPRWNPSWLSNAWTSRKDPVLEWLAIKLKTVSHVAEESSWVPLAGYSPPRHPFSIKSLAVSVRVSPQTIHFWVLDKSPLSCPRRSPSSCKRIFKCWKLIHIKKKKKKILCTSKSIWVLNSACMISVLTSAMIGIWAFVPYSPAVWGSMAGESQWPFPHDILESVS